MPANTPPEVESAEELALRCGHNLDALVVVIRERDAAIRRAALLEAIRVCEQFERSERDAGPNERMGDGSPDVAIELALRIRTLAEKAPR